ncbi:MAG: lysophospholipid acyltransferase family protein [Actinomycetota bacterium]
MSDFTYPVIVGFAKTLSRCFGIRVRVDGAKNLPTTGGAVVAINHIGYLDFVYAGWAADSMRPKRLIRFAAKKEVFDHRLAGPLMRGMHHIPVDRASGAASYRDCLAVLKSGELVGMFPEATISRSFELKEFKTGSTRMAAAAGVPLVPTVVWGTQRIMTKGRKPDLQRGATVLVFIGEPLHPVRSDDATAVTAELKSRMQTLLDRAQADYPPTSDKAGKWWLPRRLGGTAPTFEEASELDRVDTERRAAKHQDSPES